MDELGLGVNCPDSFGYEERNRARFGDKDSSVSFERHACVFYNCAEHLWNICLPLIRDGLRDGLKCLYIADDHTAEDVRSVFESHLPAYPSPTQVASAAELTAFAPPISINSIITQLSNQVEAALSEGFAGLMVFIETTWLLRTWSGMSYLGEYESALQELATRLPVLRIICLYKRYAFPGSLLLDAFCTHPDVYTMAGPHRNPHFLPPAVFLSGDDREKFRWWLKTISPALIDPQPVATQSTAPEKSSSSITYASHVTTKVPTHKLESLTPLVTSDTNLPRWKIHCLGRLQVYRQNGTPVNWNVVKGATLKTKTLFAYLLFRGQQGATAEEIADLLWPGAKAMEQSLNRLYHTVHCLRMALSPELTTSRDSPFLLTCDQRYFLTIPKDSWIDTLVFEELCYQGERLLRDNDDEQALVCHRAAEELYKGNFLEDLPLDYTENIEQDWCWSRRYWLQEMYLKMLTYMATIHRRRGDIDKARVCCDKVLRVAPCHEMAHQEMIRIFHAAGRRDALQRQYRLYVQALEQFEEGPPSPATQVLYQSLMTTL